MSDSKRKKAHDAKLASIREDYEVGYIASKFDISKRRVREVIRKVGRSRRKVYAELRGVL